MIKPDRPNCNNYEDALAYPKVIKNSWKITLKFFQLDINELKNESFVHSLQICLEQNKWSDLSWLAMAHSPIHVVRVKLSSSGRLV